MAEGCFWAIITAPAIHVCLRGDNRGPMLSVMRMFTDALTSCLPPVLYFIVSSENLVLLYVTGLEKHILSSNCVDQMDRMRFW